ncbi:serine carboxypeptidase-like 51 [Pistacia vera]|uniref:serine carboxypeptidase-like 51 n=1 Tax=Pistacia vera TaxID=55513 RepID=UPI001263D885|nr:serine carboxypeptidase-like 51 [Pistacia vera]
MASASASLLKSSPVLDKSEWVNGQTIICQPSVSVVRCHPNAPCALTIRAGSYVDELVKTVVLSSSSILGVALGDSWISLEDFVLSWGPLLKDVSRLDNNGLEKSNSLGQKIKQQLEDGQFVDATNSWSELEEVINASSRSVVFYNFLLDSGMDRYH